LLSRSYGNGMRWVVTLGIVVSAAMALASCVGGSTTTVTTTAAIRMPRVAGQDATRAEAILHDVGLKTSYIAVPNKARPGTVLGQYPAFGSPVPRGSKATLTISASPGARNEAKVVRGGTPCGVIHFTGVPHEARAIAVKVGSCDEAKKLVRTAHGTLGGCEKGARCDVGDYTCTQSYFGGPSMAVRCVSRKPANAPGPSTEVGWEWAGYGSDSSSSPASHLNCGSGVAGSERALRQFFAILRAGNEAEVRSVLADPGRFAWLTVGSNGPGGPHWFVNVRRDPNKAARAVAQSGGLPLRIVRFTNSEAPHRTTDFGFVGRWNGTRPLVGKAAIDCKVGKARVLSVEVGRP
jgi:PASTA domain